MLRLGLERGSSAEEAMSVITRLLEQHGQGGQCSNIYEDFYYHNSFLIVDDKEAWVLETAAKHWVAERVTGNYYPQRQRLMTIVVLLGIKLN